MLARSADQGPAGRPFGEGPAALPTDLAALFFVESTPHPRVLAGVQGPAETFAAHGTRAAYGLGALALDDRGAGDADGEEELGVLAQAARALDPRRLAGVVPESRFNRGPSSGRWRCYWTRWGRP